MHKLLIILLLLASFFLSFLRLHEYPLITKKLHHLDGTRDYLVAHYIAKSGERPLLGPYNSLYGLGIKNSPTYFYLLAVFLKIKDSVIFLQIINIFFHIATICLIYLIAKSLFGPIKAILASLFFSVIPIVFVQAVHVWQPHQMQPFAYLALFLLIIAYQKSNFKIALLSLVILCFAGSLYVPAFAWLPIFLILMFLMVRKKAQRLKFYLIICLTLILSISIFYLPVLVYYLETPQVFKYINNNRIYFSPSLYDFVSNLTENFSSVMKLLSLNLYTNPKIDRLIAAILITSSIIYYFFTQHTKRKATVFFGSLFFISPIVTSSFIEESPTYIYHQLFLTFAIFAILATEIVVSSTRQILRSHSHRLRMITQLIIILLLIKTFSSDFDFVLTLPKKQSSGLLALNEAVFFIEQEISRIKVEKNIPHTSFFQVASFRHHLSSPSHFYPPLDTAFLVPLEKNLQTKLAKTSDNNPLSLIQTNSDNFIFLVCVEYYSKHFVRDCTDSFSQYYPNHRVIKNIYTKHPLSVYLTKNIYQMN